MTFEVGQLVRFNKDNQYLTKSYGSDLWEVASVEKVPEYQKPRDYIISVTTEHRKKHYMSPILFYAKRFEPAHVELKYDPTQQGDTEDDL